MRDENDLAREMNIAHFVYEETVIREKNKIHFFFGEFSSLQFLKLTEQQTASENSEQKTGCRIQMQET